ncbi:UNVERIFIED_ORG: hypothetical protein GGE53_003328 [Rhizobium etli]
MMPVSVNRCPHPNPLPVLTGRGDVPCAEWVGTKRARHIPFAPFTGEGAGRRMRGCGELCTGTPDITLAQRSNRKRRAWLT